MTNETEKLNNVRRLAYALYQRHQDAPTMQRLAQILHYDQRQLVEDIVDLENYTYDRVKRDRAEMENSDD